MYTSILAFAIGVISLLCFSTLPKLIWLIVILFGSGVLGYYSPWLTIKIFFRWLTIIALGLIWALIHAQAVLHWSLPADEENKLIHIQGTIASLPQLRGQAISFLFKLQSIEQQPQHTLLRLAWYDTYPHLSMGEQWQLTVRLKKPHGLINPGGFDYEKWLFANRIRATGEVINSTYNRQLNSHFSSMNITNIRQNLLIQLNKILATKTTAGFIAALTVGVQSGITEPQWQVLRATGTNHLMAIAGVHIGFVTGFIYFLIYWCWRRFYKLPLIIPAKQAAAAAALIAAIFYSALAGFSLPTQRALIMTVAVLFSLLLQRQFSPWHSLLLALIAVLIWDPLAVLTESFWLSFTAVFFIIYGLSNRLRSSVWYVHWAKLQWLIAIGLIPFCLWLFNQASLVAIVANMIAVPWVGFFVLPFCLAGGVLLLVHAGFLAKYLLLIAAESMTLIWRVLTWLANFPHAVWHQTIPNIGLLLLALIAVLIVLMPAGMPGRWLGIFWFLPIIFYKPPAPSQVGEMWLTVLDVGQGLSLVVRTQHHTLIYDTGPKYENFDAGADIVLPYLYTIGVKQIDTMIVSHGDNDHIGGAAAIIANFPVQKIFTSIPSKIMANNVTNCYAGQHWNWDGVNFTMLYPILNQPYMDNNSSCVLRIDNGQQAILLTGDIEKLVEDYLVKNAANHLTADVLVAPHHGSNSSSSINFVNAVHPQYVLFPVGYLNRYHFPSSLVIQRYQSNSAQLLNTAIDGAVHLFINRNKPIHVTTERKIQSAFWRSILQ